jgi:adenine-specific DNA-methyltransferase
MKGYVPTPDSLVDKMVDRLFFGLPPKPTDFLLDPGCADGQFVAGVLRWCRLRKLPSPRIIGVELDPVRASQARERFKSEPCVEIVEADYLLSPSTQRYRYVIGNPPYVSLEHIGEKERAVYRAKFLSARGRFDLYMLFFEQALRQTLDEGRLVFVTPEKFIYVETAVPLRKLLARYQVEAIDLVAEDTFSDRTTYPSVTALAKTVASCPTSIRLRDGTTRSVRLPTDGTTWLPFLMGHDAVQDGMVALSAYCRRISAGIATGADGVFLLPANAVNGALRQFAYPALAGRDIALSQDTLPVPNRMLLVPYEPSGALLAETKLGALGTFLRKAENRQKLEMRTCTKNKPWYAFHDNCPLPHVRLPKILCKDIGERPKFWIDRTGAILPLHSLYYLVPNEGTDLDALCAWLNGPEAATWLTNHCQRAANGFMRLQSRVIRNLPVPAQLPIARIKKVA